MAQIESAKHMNDEQLMIQYQNGDHRAFEVLYGRHESRVYSYLKRRLPNSDAVEEVFQNAFLKVHKSRHNFNPKFLFVQWLYTVVRSELLDYCKKKKVVHIEYTDQGHSLEKEEDDLDLDKFQSLSDREKKVINMKFISDSDYEEISIALDISQSNARKIFSRAIKKIKNALQGDKVE